MFTISINLTLCIGYACLADKNPYRHDRRADKNLYLHDRRADKNTYRHDRRADSQCLRIDTFQHSVVKDTGLRPIYLMFFKFLPISFHIKNNDDMWI